jgi:hypothetical protein
MWLQPGTECYLRAMGGLHLKFDGKRVFNGDREVKRIGLLAGGTGRSRLSSMLPLCRVQTSKSCVV